MSKLADQRWVTFRNQSWRRSSLVPEMILQQSLEKPSLYELVQIFIIVQSSFRSSALVTDCTATETQVCWCVSSISGSQASCLIESKPLETGLELAGL